jgi:hypothetical protein
MNLHKILFYWLAVIASKCAWLLSFGYEMEEEKQAKSTHRVSLN